MPIQYTHVVQPFEPFYDSDSTVLILGSLPSVKSRETGFFYGNKQNRFWKVLTAIFEPENAASAPLTLEEKKSFLKRHHIALFDSIKECNIRGSSDSSITDVVPSTPEIEKILTETKVNKIILNGMTAAKYFYRYWKEKNQAAIKIDNRNVITTKINRPKQKFLLYELPSTSSANASYSLEELIKSWKACF